MLNVQFPRPAARWRNPEAPLVHVLRLVPNCGTQPRSIPRGRGVQAASGCECGLTYRSELHHPIAIVREAT